MKFWLWLSQILHREKVGIDDCPDCGEPSPMGMNRCGDCVGE